MARIEEMKSKKTVNEIITAIAILSIILIFSLTLPSSCNTPISETANITGRVVNLKIAPLNLFYPERIHVYLEDKIVSISEPYLELPIDANIAINKTYTFTLETTYSRGFILPFFATQKVKTFKIVTPSE